MAEPHGPIRINNNRQIALPKALVERVRLEPGDSVYVLQSDDDPSSLVVVPVERITAWIEAGRRLEQTGDGAGAKQEVEDDG